MTRVEVETAFRDWCLVWDGRNAGDCHTREYLEARLRTCCYHEAGHAAMAGVLGPAFLGRLQRITVIPMGADLTPLVERTVLRYQPALVPANRKWFRAELLTMLGGPVAGHRIAGDALEPREVALAMRSEHVGVQAEDLDPSATDWAKSAGLADQVAGGAWTRERVLLSALSWAVEIMAIPEVWRAVERCASELAATGEIRGPGEVGRLFGHLKVVLDGLPDWRKWRGRIPDTLIFVPDCPEAAGFSGDDPLDWWAGHVDFGDIAP